MKISNLIFFSIFFILLLFSITTYINNRQSEEVRANAQFLATSSTVVRLSNQFQRNILYMERSLRGYIVTGEDYLLQNHDTAFIENDSLLAELSANIPRHTKQYQLFNEISMLYARWVKESDKPLIAASQQNIPSNILVDEVLRQEEKLNRVLQQKFRELLNVEYANRDERREILERSEQETKLISIVLTGLSIVVGCTIAIFLARHISRRIMTMVNMANSIAHGHYDVQVQDNTKDELGELSQSLNHMARQLQENVSLLKRKNTELDQFAHIVSHDLKAPLRGIDTVLSWVEEDHSEDLPLKVKEYLRLIKGRIQRSENLIEGILTFSRIGKEPHEKEKINVTALLHEVVANLPVRQGLHINIPTDLPEMHTERIPLSMVFSNLVSNAIKYHDKPTGTIHISANTRGSKYVFAVADDGPGIAPAYHQKVFVIFQTLQERDSFESTGVGLAIVKKILDDRNETIQIEPTPGGGTTFSFTWAK